MITSYNNGFKARMVQRMTGAGAISAMALSRVAVPVAARSASRSAATSAMLASEPQALRAAEAEHLAPGTQTVSQLSGLAFLAGQGALLTGDYFGQQVAASTSYVAVAAPGRTLNAGAVYLYKFDPLGMVWKQTTPTGPLVLGSAPGEQLGSALAMSATTLAVGSAAYSPSPLVFAQGGVQIFSLEKATAPIPLTLADPAPRDRFGAALSLVPPAAGLPEILLVGAPGRNQAFVYNNLEPWQRSAVLEVPLEGARSAVGSSVATTGTRHLLGTRGLAQEIGGAYFYSGN